MSQLQINKVSDGLGYGDGKISEEFVRSEAGQAQLDAADAVINSPDILIEVSTGSDGHMIDDDGCGDGRGVRRIFDDGLWREIKSLNRAKVFGGGATMATADLIGSGAAKSRSLLGAFRAGIENMKHHMLNFGAHTDEHAEHNLARCGCGAIDRAPEVVPAIAKYRNEIGRTLAAFGISIEYLDEVVNNFADYAQGIGGQYFSGRAVVDEIINSGKIVKELAGAHKEARIVLNFVRGYTVNQQAVREATGDTVEVFGIDAWRLEELAKKLHPQQDETNPDPQVEADQKRAYLSMLVYTLGTASVLTKGDLPIYVTQLKPELTPAPTAA